jgi:hypothetical protein
MEVNWEEIESKIPTNNHKDKAMPQQSEIFKPESQSSVELTSTSKGTNVTVKCYNQDVQLAALEAQTLYDELLKKYSQTKQEGK